MDQANPNYLATISTMVIRMFLIILSKACTLAYPFLQAICQLFEAHSHKLKGKRWRAAGAVAIAVTLIFVGLKKL